MFVTIDTDGAWPICLALGGLCRGQQWTSLGWCWWYTRIFLGTPFVSFYNSVFRSRLPGYLYIYWDEVSLSDGIVAGARTESILRKIIHQPIIISNFPGIRFLIQWLEFISRELSAIACWPRWRGNILSRPPLLWCSEP